jgi:hypothetical protein
MKPLAVSVQGVFDKIIVISNPIERCKRASRVVPRFAFLPKQVDVERIIGVF